MVWVAVAMVEEPADTGLAELATAAVVRAEVAVATTEGMELLATARMAKADCWAAVGVAWAATAAVEKEALAWLLFLSCFPFAQMRSTRVALQVGFMPLAAGKYTCAWRDVSP